MGFGSKVDDGEFLMVMDVEDKIIGDLEFLGRFIQLIRTSGCRVSDLLLNFSHVAESPD